MSRKLFLSAVFGLFAAGVGCKHVGGRCDCQGTSPADAALPTAGVAYPTIGAANPGVVVAPATAAPAALAPNPAPTAAATPEKMPAPR